jgi:cytochrome b561
LRNTPTRHGAVAQAFHWLTAALVLGAYVFSKGDGYSLYAAEADGIRRIHETLGVLVFAVVAMRLSWGLVDEAPPKPPASRWMAIAARVVRLALYALLILIPATAVVGTWFEGIPVTLTGLDIAPQVARAHALGQSIIQIHKTLGNTMLWAAGAHAAAALFHHFYLRDHALRSMLPGGRMTGRS